MAVLALQSLARWGLCVLGLLCPVAMRWHHFLVLGSRRCAVLDLGAGFSPLTFPGRPGPRPLPALATTATPGSGPWAARAPSLITQKSCPWRSRGPSGQRTHWSVPSLLDRLPGQPCIAWLCRISLPRGSVNACPWVVGLRAHFFVLM